MQRGIKPPQANPTQLLAQQQQQQQFGIVYEKRPGREHRSSSSASGIPKHRSHSAVPQPPPPQQHQQNPEHSLGSNSSSSLRYGLRPRHHQLQQQQPEQQQRCHSNSGSRTASPAPPLAPSRLTSGRHAMPSASSSHAAASQSAIPRPGSSGIPQPQGRRGSAAAAVAVSSDHSTPPPSSLPQPQQRHQRARSEQPQSQLKPPTQTASQLPQPGRSAIPAPSSSSTLKSRPPSKKPPTPQSGAASALSSSSASAGRRLLSRPTMGQPNSSSAGNSKSESKTAASVPSTNNRNSATTSSSNSLITCDASDEDISNRSLQIDCSDLDDALNNADELSISSSELSDAVAELERSVCTSAGGEGRATPDLYGLTLRKASADYGASRSSSNRLQQLMASENCSGAEYYFSDTESVQRQQQQQLLQQHHQRRRTGLAGSAVSGSSGYCTIRSAAGQAPACLPMSAAVPPTPSQSLRLPYATMRSSCSTGSFYPGVGAGSNGIGGSTLSIYSAVSSSATTANEERQAMEIAKLRAELEQAQQRIACLAGQLCANTDAAEAFEQSLSDVTSRLRDLASSAERKDTELARLRAAVGALKREEAPMQLMMQKEMQQQQQQPSSSKRHGWLRSLRSSKKQQQQQQQKQQQTQQQPPPNQQSEEPPALSELELQQQQKQPSAAELQQLRSLTEQMRADISNLKAENCRLQQLQQLQQQTRGVDSLSDDHGFGGSVNDVYGGFGGGVVGGGGGTRRLSVDSAALSVISVGDGSLDGRCDSALASHQIHSHSLGFDLVDGFPGSADSLRLTVLAGDNHPVGCLPVCPRTKWETLDACCGRLFKEYLSRIDPSQGLGLGSDCVVAYEILGSNVGIRRRGAASHACPPPLVACMSAASASLDPQRHCIRLQLHLASELDTLALETLVPKPTLQRYIGLLREHRRIALCGPSGVGKSRLASRLAAHLAAASSSSVATFSADRRSERSLRSFLNGINKTSDVNVGAVVLDNLHLVDSLSEILSACLPTQELPPYFIIGAMTQGGSVGGTGQAERLHAAKLELHSACNFRWVLCSAHMEPVRGLLGRCLRQRLVAAEVDAAARLPEMSLVADWLQEAWLRLNRLLETHAGAESALGPGQFLACPMDSWRGAEQWFLRLWNHCLVPYVIEACREGLRSRGARAPWEDPAVKMQADWPWGLSGDVDELIGIRPEDVGYEASRYVAAAAASSEASSTAATSAAAPTEPSDNADTVNDELLSAGARGAPTTTDDRLMAMLMRLQEVANCGLASDLTDSV